MWNYNDYQNWMRDRLNEVKNSLDFNDYAIEVFNEQDYAKRRSILPKTITVITRFLASSMIFNVKTQPIQILIVAEENGLATANSILSKFCEQWNFVTTKESTTAVKHQYSTPVVLNNFNLIGMGLRSVLYISANLNILDNLLDMTDIKVNLDPLSFEAYNDDTPYHKGDIVAYSSHIYQCIVDETNADHHIGFDANEWTRIYAIELDPISATIGYVMSGDTQPFTDMYAETEKNFATFSMSINVASTDTPFTQAALRILAKKSRANGNDGFTFSFKIGDMDFSNFKTKMVGLTFTTAKTNAPSLQMSFNI